MSSLNNPATSPIVVDKNKKVGITSMPYTLPADGWVTVYLNRGKYGTAGLQNVVTEMTVYEASTQGNYPSCAIMLGKKGDVISIVGDGSPYFLSGIFNRFI